MRLKELRKKKKISQKDLAEYLHITQVQISKYELGKNEPDLETVKKLSKYFNVTIDYLLDEEEKDIILITRKDFETLKKSTEEITKIVKKLADLDNITIGDGNEIKNSFNKK